MKQPETKTDDEFVDIFRRFIPKFECAVSRMRSKGLLIHDRIEYKWLNISGGRYDEVKRLHRIYGPQCTPNHWYAENEEIIRTATAHAPQFYRQHPFAYMLDGKFSYSWSRNGERSPHEDIEIMFGFIPGSIGNGFAQGFSNSHYYKDCWRDQHWSLSACFNIGRIMFNKHIAPLHGYGNLPFVIPPKLESLF